LSKGDLRAETVKCSRRSGSKILTPYNRRIQTETGGHCRLYQQLNETVDHIVSACPVLAKEQYVKRHDTDCAPLHLNIYMEIGLKLDNETRHDHVHKVVETSCEGEVQVQTDRTISDNRSYIIIGENKKKEVQVDIDVAIAGDPNAIKK
jgi:hypothetical protein